MVDPGSLSPFELPAEAPRRLALLSKLYTRKGNPDLAQLVTKSRIRIEENTTSGDFGSYGHTLYLEVPEDTFLDLVDSRIEIALKIREDLNRVCDIRDEFWDEVIIQLASDEASGAAPPRPDLKSDSSKDAAAAAAEARIWATDSYRVFLSHRSDVKTETAELKTVLEIFGVSAFVAHADIQPTKTWQDEIEVALGTADALVALLTADFHTSDWTDQEVGFAMARGIPIVAVKLGRDPYGFIGKFQALRSTWTEAPDRLVHLLLADRKMVSAYIHSVRKCKSFDDGNRLAAVLPSIKALSREDADELLNAYETNDQVSGSYGFNGGWPSQHGKGLVHFLNEHFTQKYRYGEHRKIEKV